MPLTHDAATEDFLVELGILGPAQDEVDVDYLKDVHRELWDECSARASPEEMNYKIVNLRNSIAALIDIEKQQHLWGIIDVMLAYLGDWREEGVLNDLQARGLINGDGRIK